MKKALLIVRIDKYNIHNLDDNDEQPNNQNQTDNTPKIFPTKKNGKGEEEDDEKEKSVQDTPSVRLLLLNRFTKSGQQPK